MTRFIGGRASIVRANCPRASCAREPIGPAGERSHLTASTALPNSAKMLPPAVLAIRPRCFSIWFSLGVLWLSYDTLQVVRKRSTARDHERDWTLDKRRLCNASAADLDNPR